MNKLKFFLITFGIIAISLINIALSREIEDLPTVGELTDTFVYEFTFTDDIYPTDGNYQIAIQYRKPAQTWTTCKIMKISEFEEWKTKSKTITGQIKIAECVKEIGNYEFRLVGGKDLKAIDFESNYKELIFQEKEAKRCKAPKILGCKSGNNPLNNPSWTTMPEAKQYRLEWCYKYANFEERDFKSGDCGYITTDVNNVYVGLSLDLRDYEYKARVRVEQSDSCITGKWSGVKECSFQPEQPKISIDVPKSVMRGQTVTVTAKATHEKSIDAFEIKYLTTDGERSAFIECKGKTECEGIFKIDAVKGDKLLIFPETSPIFLLKDKPYEVYGKKVQFISADEYTDKDQTKYRAKIKIDETTVEVNEDSYVIAEGFVVKVVEYHKKTPDTIRIKLSQINEIDVIYKPDLIIESIKFDKHKSGLILATIIVKNVGNNNVEKTSKIGVGDATETLSPLDAGNHARVEIPLPSASDGQEVLVKVDATNSIDELSETNNEFKAVIKFELKKVGENKKLESSYSDREVFLISDDNWQDILTLIPLTVWTDKNQIKSYPTLIFHREDSSGFESEFGIETVIGIKTIDFDVDSIIYFMQQYNAKSITIVGDTPKELDNLLIAKSPLGAGIGEKNIKRIYVDKYPSYWESFDTVVYVQDSYELALLASTYASLINAPLVIKGGELETYDMFAGRKIICVGDVEEKCDESYNLEELQKKYVEKTGTDKIILVNPKDLEIAINELMAPEKGGKISKLYGKLSLSAPILASAKHELIISSNTPNYEANDKAIENAISRLALNANYLTIVAMPESIQQTKKAEYYLDGTSTWESEVEEVDNHIYGDLNGDHFPDLAVGRIYGITVSDVSSYMARDIFYDYLKHSNEFAVLWAPEEPWLLATAKTIDRILSSTGLNSKSVYVRNELEHTDFNEGDFENKAIIVYMDHGSWMGGAFNYNSYFLIYNKIYFQSTLVISVACSTNSFDRASDTQYLFGTQLIRRGALGHIGNVETSFYGDIGHIISQRITKGQSIGNAMKDAKIMLIGSFLNSKYEPHSVLLGDPTIRLSLTPQKDINEVELYINRDANLIKIHLPSVKNILKADFSDFKNKFRYSGQIFESYIGDSVTTSYNPKTLMKSAGWEVVTYDEPVNKLISSFIVSDTEFQVGDVKLDGKAFVCNNMDPMTTFCNLPNSKESINIHKRTDNKGDTWVWFIASFDRSAMSGEEIASRDYDIVLQTADKKAKSETGCQEAKGALIIEKDTTLCKKVYTPYGSEVPRILIKSSNIVLDCNGASISGNGEGIGIDIKGVENVDVKNCKISGFKFGLYASDSKNIHTTDNDISRNFKMAGTGWIHINEKNPYGGGIVFERVADSLIDSNILREQQDGISFIDVTGTTVSNNKADSNNGWGIKLYNSKNNVVDKNDFSHTFKPCSNDIVSELCRKAVLHSGNEARLDSDKVGCGCDTAAVLLVALSTDNKITNNDLRYSGDGLFINGREGPSNNNYIAFNDATGSPHNAFEATFSSNNIFYKNIASESDYGFWLGYSTDTKLEENTIIGNTNGINADRASNLKITKNTINSNKDYGTKLWEESAEKVEEDYSGSKSKGHEINNNYINNNGGNGIWIQDTDSISVNNNEISGNKQSNVRLERTVNAGIISNNLLTCIGCTSIIVDDKSMATAIINWWGTDKQSDVTKQIKGNIQHVPFYPTKIQGVPV